MENNARLEALVSFINSHHIGNEGPNVAKVEVTASGSYLWVTSQFVQDGCWGSQTDRIPGTVKAAKAWLGY